jgi:hypothetical protein
MTKGAARTAAIAVMVACIAFHLSFLLVQINLCQPVRHIQVFLGVMIDSLVYDSLLNKIRLQNNGILPSLRASAYLLYLSTPLWHRSPYYSTSQCMYIDIPLLTLTNSDKNVPAISSPAQKPNPEAQEVRSSWSPRPRHLHHDYTSHSDPNHQESRQLSRFIKPHHVVHGREQLRHHCRLYTHASTALQVLRREDTKEFRCQIDEPVTVAVHVRAEVVAKHKAGLDSAREWR